jgi:hypothetical protein
VTGCCEDCDEPAGCDATDLVSYKRCITFTAQFTAVEKKVMHLL